MGFKVLPKRNFLKSDSSYRASDLFLKIAFPVWKKLKPADPGQFRFSTILLNSSHVLTTGNLSFLEKRLSQLHSNIGLSYLTIRGKNTWILSAAGNLFTDTRYLSASVIRPTGLLIYARKVNRKFSYRAGLGYSFLLGKGIPLPVLGFTLKSGEKGRFSMTLPYRISYSIRHSNRYKSLLYIRPEGNIGMINSNLGQDSISTKPFLIRNRAFSLGYQGTRALKKYGQIQFDAGFLLRRKLTITNPDFQAIERPKPIFSDKLKGCLFLELKWILRFGSRKEVSTPSPYDSSSPIPDNLDLKDVDVNDLDIQ